MPTIWVKGNRYTFHLAGEYLSRKGAFDAPYSAIPASKITRISRYRLSWKDRKDVLIFDIAPQGRVGDCISCGQCCSHPKDQCPTKKCGYEHRGKFHVCEHLIEYPRNGGIGHPGGTACRIYETMLAEGRKDCLIYPASPEGMQPACGMRFE